MNSFENFIWDCYIKSYENSDALIEASASLTDEEKFKLMHLNGDSIKVWRKLFNDRQNYFYKHVKFNSYSNLHAIDNLEFHPKYGWTVYYKDEVAYFGKSSIYGNLNLNIGRNTYFSGHSTLRGNGQLDIGSFCSFGYNIYLNASNQNHPINFPASIGIFNEIRLGESGNQLKYENMPSTETTNFIQIGSDVWIGQSTTIFNNINIGHGSAVGAHSLVTKDCEPYGIYAGKPARLIRFRFTKSIIEELLEIKWWEWPQDKILRNNKFFNTDLKEYKGIVKKLVVN